MAGTDSSGSRIIPPAIDTADLINFHLDHFQGSYPIGMERLDPKTTTSQDVESHNNYNHEEEDEDDNGLGYYPDGAKRTLTDDQIEFLRASELRQQRQQQQQ